MSAQHTNHFLPTDIQATEELDQRRYPVARTSRAHHKSYKKRASAPFSTHSNNKKREHERTKNKDAKMFERKGRRFFKRLLRFLRHLRAPADASVQVRGQLPQEPPAFVLAAVVPQPLRELRKTQAAPTNRAYPNVHRSLSWQKRPVLGVSPGELSQMDGERGECKGFEESRI